MTCPEFVPVTLFGLLGYLIKGSMHVNCFLEHQNITSNAYRILTMIWRQRRQVEKYGILFPYIVCVLSTLNKLGAITFPSV